MSSTGGPRGEEEAWRAIVENYGERPRLSDTDLPPAPGDGTAAPAGADHEPPQEPPHEPPLGDPDEAIARALHAQERYVPPPPPPIPRPGPDRMLAWAGVFGAPVLLLLLLVTGFPLPSWAGYLLVAWFVGGFLYLVSQLPRGPQDPFDDGARV